MQYIKALKVSLRLARLEQLRELLVCRLRVLSIYEQSIYLIFKNDLTSSVRVKL
jgi:hypothetical protein